jgi:hypothetical protein
VQAAGSPATAWGEPPAAGPAFMTSTGGGQEVISAITAAGGATTLDLADGNVFSVTLAAGTTFTFTGAMPGVACSFTLYLTQGGPGGYTATWPSSVAWPAGTAPVLPSAAGAVAVLVFESLDGGAGWYGFPVASFPGAAA